MKYIRNCDIVCIETRYTSVSYNGCQCFSMEFVFCIHCHCSYLLWRAYARFVSAGRCALGITPLTWLKILDIVNSFIGRDIAQIQ